MAATCRSATVGKHSASAPLRKGSAPFAVLNGKVDMYELTGEPGERWRRIECVRKKAYGCGDLGQELVESLSLYVRFGDYPVLSSSLAIRISDKTVRWLEAELGAPDEDKRPDDWLRRGGTIQVADQRLIAIILVFQHDYCTDLAYYLVYDDIDSSLSLIKYLPDYHETVCTMRPVLYRIGDRGGDYELVRLARKLPSCTNNEGVLCMCTPDSRANPSADGMSPWNVKGWRFPEEVWEPFGPDVVFAFEGKAFLADFTQGCLLYCDLHIRGSVADFHFISLPHKCLLDPDEPPPDEPIEKIRTMGCVGDSIWFVCIHRSESPPQTCADDILTMWTLDLARKQWQQEVEISAKSLWKLDCFKKAGLPKASLDYPVLMSDGSLCLVLLDQHGYNEFGPIDYCIFCIDVRRGKLLWHGRVHDYHASSPFILPSNFIQRMHAPAKGASKHLPRPRLTLAGLKVVLPY